VVRKLLAIMGAAALAAVLTPVSAQAAPQDNSGVVVFVGDSTIGSGAYTGATGDGLCYPNLDARPGACAPSPGQTTEVDNGWKFRVPGNNVNVGGVTQINATCNAYGRFGGTTVFTISTSPGNCSIDSDGIVKGNAVGVGPSCGMSYGTSVGGDTAPNGPDTFTVGSLSGPIVTTWITSAGGTLPLVGSYTVGGVTANYVGVVQARPIGSPGQVPCATEPATTFTVVGVVAGSEALPPVA